jgi:hypothetical protein
LSRDPADQGIVRGVRFVAVRAGRGVANAHRQGTAVAARAAGNPGINNTAYLFFVIALAFIVYITVKGDLPKWLGLLGLGGTPAGSTAASAATTGTPAVAGGLPGLPGLPTLGQSVSPEASVPLDGASSLLSTSNPFGSVSSDASNALTYGSGDLAPGNTGSSQIIDVFGPQDE